MDHAVGLPLVDVLAIPPIVRQQLPCLTPPTQHAVPRIYAVACAVQLRVRDPSGLGTDEAVDGAPSPFGTEATACLLVVSYHTVVLWNHASGLVDAVMTLSQGSLQPDIAINPGDGNNGKRRQLLAPPQLSGMCRTQDDDTWVVLHGAASTSSGASQGGVQWLLQFPVQQERIKCLHVLQTLFRYHRGTEMDVTQVVQYRDLRESWERWCRRVAAAEGPSSSLLLPPADSDKSSIRVHPSPLAPLQLQPSSIVVPLQLRHVLNRQHAVVGDRMRYARDAYTAVELSTNAALADMEKDIDRAFGLMDVRRGNTATEEGVLNRWDRELDENERQYILAEAELRRAKDAARQAVREREQTIVRCTEEAQGWRRVLSVKQQEELKLRELLIEAQQRAKTSTENAESQLTELRTELSRAEKDRSMYEAEPYVALVQERDAVLASVRQAQAELEQYERKESHQIKDRTAAIQRSCRTVSATNEALRKLIVTSHAEAAQEATAQADLDGDQQGFADEIVALEDALMLVDLELAQATSERAALETECRSVESRVSALAAASDEKQKTVLANPLLRYRVAKLRMYRARKERQTLELCAARAASVQHSTTCDLQQQLLYEAIRAHSPIHRREREEASPFLLDDQAQEGDEGGAYDDDALDAMLEELRRE